MLVIASTGVVHKLTTIVERTRWLVFTKMKAEEEMEPRRTCTVGRAVKPMSGWRGCIIAVKCTTRLGVRGRESRGK